nr:reverse transcriptase domain-containing protein [Tanacetum cinerariifolium]
MIFNIDSAMKHSYSNDDTCFSIDVIDEILEEDFNALLDEGIKILYSIKGTPLEEEIFFEFDEFMAMTVVENFDPKSDTKEPPFEKITINTNYKIKTSLEEPPMDLEHKPLPDNLEYVFLEEPSFLPVIISSQLSKEKKNKLISVLKKHKQAFAWKTTDIPGIFPSFFAGSPWVSPIHCVPKKGGIIVITNEDDELVPTRTVIGWQEKCHFMVKEGIVLGYKVSSSGLEVDKAKTDVILKLTPPINIKEFDIAIKDRKGTKNIAADHLSRIENDELRDENEVNDYFPRETLIQETRTILDKCHHGPTGGHYGPNVTAKKGIDFMRPFSKSYKFEYTLVAIDYVSKWAEAQALPTNDA